MSYAHTERVRVQPTKEVVGSLAETRQVSSHTKRAVFVINKKTNSRSNCKSYNQHINFTYKKRKNKNDI